MAEIADSTVNPDVRDRAAARASRSTLVALAFAGLVVSVQQTLVLPLLPAMQQDFHTSLTAVTWVFTVTLLSGAVATPLLSRLGDMYGKKQMIALIMALLIAGSLICALTSSLGVVLVGRALQGISVAVIPLAIGTIRDAFPRERVMTAIGVVSATLSVGGTAGMLLTGVIAAHTTSFHPVFWIATGIAALGLVLVVAWVPATGHGAGGRTDVPGAAALAVWLVCLLLALTEGGTWGWTSAGIIGLFAGAVVVCALWVWIEMRVPEPLVRMQVLVGPRSLPANLASVLLGFGMYSSFTLVSGLVQTHKAQSGFGLNGSVVDVGLYLLPGTVATFVFSMLCGRFEARIGAVWTLAAGSAILGAAYLWIALSNAHVYDVLIFSVLQGIGFGIGYAALGTAAVAHVPMDQSAIASGVNSLVRTAGGSLGTAVAAALLAGYLIPGTALPALHGYTVSFLLAAVTAALAAAVAAGQALRHGR